MLLKGKKYNFFGFHKRSDSKTPNSSIAKNAIFLKLDRNAKWSCQAPFFNFAFNCLTFTGQCATQQENGTLTRKRTHSSERANECNFKLPRVGAHPKYPITQSPTSPNIIVTNDQVWEKTWWKEKFFYFPPKRVQSMHFCPAVARLMIGWWDGIGRGT